MTGHKTVFDRDFRQEENAFLPDGIFEKQSTASKMLLHQYNTMIFEPRPEELSAATAEEFSHFWVLTSKFHGVKGKTLHSSRRIFSRVLACAAVLAVLCGLVYYFNVDNTPGEEVPGNGGDNSFYAGNFRGNNGGDASPTQTMGFSALDDEKQEPLAYLVDANGSLEIRRNGSSIRPQNSCEVLYADDVISLAEQSKAKIMYEDSFFDIVGPSEYQIAKSAPMIITRGNSRQFVTPTFTTRGAGYGTPVRTMAIAPRKLLAQIVPPITRAGDASIAVYSPRGASFTATPEISIGGDENETYAVCVLDLMGEPVGDMMKIKGNTSIHWSDLSSEALQKDEIYSLKVTLNGKIVNDANNSNFWLVSEDEAERITDAFKRFDKIESSEAREFFKANALYMNGCYAEAREIAVKLTKQHPQNQLYANFVKLCK